MIATRLQETSVDRAVKAAVDSGVEELLKNSPFEKRTRKMSAVTSNAVTRGLPRRCSAVAVTMYIRLSCI